MKNIATFHTHLGALEFFNGLKSLGDEAAELVPAPRQLSVSCGTAVCFSRPYDEASMANEDLSQVYQMEEPGKYELIRDEL